jgi:glycosyltransferase involved in cell wall biosynthesis
MKILYYAPQPHLSIHAPTGYGTHMREMVAAFRQAGAEVHTLIAGDALPGPHAAVTSTAQNPAPQWRQLVPRFIWQTARDLALLRHDRHMAHLLGEAIATHRPDVVYERIAYMQPGGVRTARACGVRHVAEINAPFPEERRSFSGPSAMLAYAKWVERYILAQSHTVVTVSTALANYLAGKEARAAQKTLVVPNCIRPEAARVDAGQVEALRQKWHLQGALVIGFVGSIFPYHGVDLLIEGFAGLEHPNARLLIVGDGASLPALHRQVEALGIVERVLFTGPVPHREVYNYIQMMDICCMAKSNWYGSPVKIFEYGLMAKAVMAPDTDPVREVMGTDCGMLVAPKPEAVHSALHTLAHSESLRLELARQWHHRVLEHHTWHRAAQTILSTCA